jgi:hypothetical protein
MDVGTLRVSELLDLTKCSNLHVTISFLPSCLLSIYPCVYCTSRTQNHIMQPVKDLQTGVLEYPARFFRGVSTEKHTKANSSSLAL